MLAGPLRDLCDLQAREREREMRMKLKLNEWRIGCRTRFKVRVKMSMFVVLFPAVIPFHLGCWLKFAVLVRCRACCRTIMSACNAIRRQEDFPFSLPVPRFHNYPHDLVALLNCQLSSGLRCLFFCFLLSVFCFGSKGGSFFCILFLLGDSSCLVDMSCGAISQVLNELNRNRIRLCGRAGTALLGLTVRGICALWRNAIGKSAKKG